MRLYLLQSRYGLPHYDYLKRRTGYFSLCLPSSSFPYARFVRTSTLPYRYPSPLPNAPSGMPYALTLRPVLHSCYPMPYALCPVQYIVDVLRRRTLSST